MVNCPHRCRSELKVKLVFRIWLKGGRGEWKTAACKNSSTKEDCFSFFFLLKMVRTKQAPKEKKQTEEKPKMQDSLRGLSEPGPAEGSVSSLQCCWLHCLLAAQKVKTKMDDGGDPGCGSEVLQNSVPSSVHATIVCWAAYAQRGKSAYPPEAPPSQNSASNSLHNPQIMVRINLHISQKAGIPKEFDSN